VKSPNGLHQAPAYNQSFKQAPSQGYEAQGKPSFQHAQSFNGFAQAF
jgi:hypothetical protein